MNVTVGDMGRCKRGYSGRGEEERRGKEREREREGDLERAVDHERGGIGRGREIEKKGIILLMWRWKLLRMLR